MKNNRMKTIYKWLNLNYMEIKKITKSHTTTQLITSKLNILMKISPRVLINSLYHKIQYINHIAHLAFWSR